MTFPLCRPQAARHSHQQKGGDIAERDFRSRQYAFDPGIQDGKERDIGFRFFLRDSPPNAISKLQSQTRGYLPRVKCFAKGSVLRIGCFHLLIRRQGLPAAGSRFSKLSDGQVFDAQQASFAAQHGSFSAQQAFSAVQQEVDSAAHLCATTFWAAFPCPCTEVMVSQPGQRCFTNRTAGLMRPFAV